jgi:hypothetical protein
MAKPSGTNGPSASNNKKQFFTCVLVACTTNSNLFLRCVNDIDQELKVKSSKLKVAILTTYNFKLITLKILRRLWRWGPPLPIPNRAVKTTSADGTRVKPGRVSRCPNFFRTLTSQVVRVFYCLNFWPGQMDRGEQLRPPNFCSDGTR